MTTIILLLSRPQMLNRLYLALSSLDCQKQNTNLLVMVDDETGLYIKVRNSIKDLGFANSLAVAVPPVKNRTNSQHFRRKRIADIHNYAAQYLWQSKYVLLIEDDGILPKNILSELTALHEAYPDAGFVSGIQVGRHLSHYYGAWYADNPSDPKEIWSLDPEAKGRHKIHAAGLYATLMRTELYEKHTFKPTANWGPDIDMGYKLSAQGYDNYIDTNLVIDHIQDKTDKVINPSTVKVVEVRMRYDRGTWRFIHKRVNINPSRKATNYDT